MAVYTPTAADAVQGVQAMKVAGETAIAVLEKAANRADRDMVTGYAGATAIRHLRLALREVEKARIQLDTLRR